ncbi:MAG: hypothetical protein JWQ74_3584 [Marmoricola sp.]|nr:hypothetical protein [Marmoricola sp.]
MIIHPRLPHWRQRLDAWVAKSVAMPFAWGAHDCGLNAGSAAEAQIGIDFADRFRGKYSTPEGGLKLLRKAGFANHADFTASVFPEIPVAFAQIGDIVAVEIDGAITLMIVAGHRLIGPMPTMAGSVALTRGFRAFAVGREPAL